MTAGDLDNFFAHENHSFPVSISEYGNLRKCSKSDFIACLTRIIEPEYEAPTVDALIIDGAAVIHTSYPESSIKTFGDYCDLQIPQKIKALARNVDWLDVVFDVYKETTLKQDTRDRRGTDGMRVSIRKDTPIQHKQFKKILTVSDNKTELFQLVADSIVTKCNEKIIVCTNGSTVISNSTLETQYLAPCNQEECDTRLFLYAYDAIRNGISRITIVANDTDVVIIALYVFASLNVNELWIEYGVGKHRRWLPIHHYAAELGEKTCQALPYWYALTGYDTVSSFARRGKKTEWETWKAYPEATDSFIRSVLMSFNRFILFIFWSLNNSYRFLIID